MINILGLAANDPVPGTYLQIDFAKGSVSSGQGDRKILLVGNKLTGGSASTGVLYGPDTEVSVTSEDDAIVRFGPGSELHCMYKQTVAVNRVSAIYCIAVPESAGAAASATMTITGTASANSVIRVRVGAQFIEVPVFLGDTPTVQAAAVQATILGKTSWPVTASAAAGVVTVTAKQKGPRGNEIKLSAQYLLPATSTVAVSAAKLTGGTTADDITGTLALLDTKNFYYIVPAANDTTQGALVASYVDTQAGPLVKNRQRAIFAHTGSLANAIVLSTALNTARTTVAWQFNSDLTPSELAASVAGSIAFKELAFGPEALNFSGYGSAADEQSYWRVPAPIDGSSPTRAQQVSALNSGLSPILPSSGGRTTLQKLCNTRFLQGSTPDFRVRDFHYVSVCDAFGGDLQARISLKFHNKNIASNPVPPADAPPNSVFPDLLRAEIVACVNQYARNGMLKNVADIKLGINCPDIQPGDPPNRLTGFVPLQVVSIADQFGLLVAESSSS